MKFILLLSATILLFVSSFGQNIYLKKPILLDVKNQYIQVIHTADSSVVTNLGSDSSKNIRIFNFSSYGGFGFRILDENKKIVIEGQYSKPDHLLKREILVRRLGKEGFEKKVIGYYMPTRKGIWKYYNGKGELIKEEDY